MICFPNAKINIGLYITKKREDGYHEIATVLYPIPLQDALEIRKSQDKTTSFKNLGIAIDDISKEKNSVYKAYKLLKRDFDLPAIEILLYKNIPFGAGLGGGSADAAFMLKLLNNYFTLNLSIEELENYAAQLGSDDPFFIKNTPQLARGRGEILEESSVSLANYYLVLLKPELNISTAVAYQAVIPKTANFQLENLAHLPIEQWRENITNDFEKGLFTKHPLLEEYKKGLYKSGAIYASLSGSGSSIYGIFHNTPKLPKYLSKNILWKGVL